MENIFCQDFKFLYESMTSCFKNQSTFTHEMHDRKKQCENLYGKYCARGLHSLLASPLSKDKINFSREDQSSSFDSENSQNIRNNHRPHVFNSPHVPTQSKRKTYCFVFLTSLISNKAYVEGLLKRCKIKL